jgi:AcrR family transcriptional regulator
MDGRTRRWEEHNESQRRRIVEAAIMLHDEGHGTASLTEIGVRAGISRAALYRQFTDREALERAVQQHILDDLWALLAPTLGLRDSVRATLHRSVAAYVDWAAAHPHLHRIAQLDASATGARERAIGVISAAVAEQLVTWFSVAGADVSAVDEAAADPLAHGLIHAVHGTVSRWVELGARIPDAAHLTTLLVESTWALIDVRLRAYGVTIDPDGDLASPSLG